ncbi:restriction endonuclease subunit S [Pseudotamlana agarivorans]|uniref:restriction endonuclease subunit S n=1 Tax=Pseudotamlana agarivorans TaxID=481183 RepID=UPI00082A3F37|nr:restriction endonuclease subunit S [Tamlana agarivorans]
MPHNWKTYKLGKVVTLQRGYDLPNSKRKMGSYPVIAASGFSSWHNEFKVKGPGVTTGRSGTLGQVYYEKNDFWPLNTSLWVKDFHGNEPKFIYYFLKTLKFEEFNSGTSVPTLNRNDVHKIDVTIPPLSEQKAIASILSAIDDKIENNLAINKTLEDMAMALYKHWFVDFGPFQNGEFVESELGQIPKGWEVKRLDDLANILNSKRIPLSSRERSTRKGKFPYYGASGIIDFIDDYLFEGEYVIISEDGENLRSRKTPIAFNAFGKFWVNNHAHIVQGKMRGINKLIISHIAQLDMNQFLTGAVQPKLNKQNLLSIGIPFPKNVSLIDELLDKFHSYSMMVISNELENQTLIQLRDTLLPKLISGDIQLKAFRQQVENAL